jgi:hypothetical protein
MEGTPTTMDAKKIQERMMAQAIRASLRHMRQASEIAGLAGVSPEAMQKSLERWKAAQLIFSAKHEGAEYFPLYAFDARANYRPLPVVKEILSIFSSVSVWAIASWFVSVNSFLNDQRPLDLLNQDPGWVIDAARDQMQGISHG